MTNVETEQVEAEQVHPDVEVALQTLYEQFLGYRQDVTALQTMIAAVANKAGGNIYLEADDLIAVMGTELEVETSDKGNVLIKVFSKEEPEANTDEIEGEPV